jgi:hypothetical protein
MNRFLKKKNKCLPVTASARRVKPFREQAPNTKPLTQIKRLLAAGDDKEVAAGTKASNGSGSIHTAQRTNQ